VRLLADTNIVAPAVARLRAEGYDVVHVGERDLDPGDQAILSESLASNRVLLTKDTDIGAIVFRDLAQHAGVLLIDDLGSPQEEAMLLLDQIMLWASKLAAGAFVRAGRWGSRIAALDDGF
jgi:predicted nuclease of predicted toxin-antitoxin system